MVALGGLVGAPARYLMDWWVQRRHDSVVPWGTVAVNATGSLLLGLLTGASSALGGELATLLGTGLCGALTTFSTFSVETTRLLVQRRPTAAVANVTVSLVAGLGLFWLGYAIARS
jgi:CrcB protein